MPDDAALPPPGPGRIRLCLYDCPREGLSSDTGQPLAAWGPVRVKALFRHGSCRRALLVPAPGTPTARAAAYFRLAPDFCGTWLETAVAPVWDGCYVLDIPAWLGRSLLREGLIRGLPAPG